MITLILCFLVNFYFVMKFLHLVGVYDYSLIIDYVSINNIPHSMFVYLFIDNNFEYIQFQGSITDGMF